MTKEESKVSSLEYQVGGVHYSRLEYQPVNLFVDLKLDPFRASIVKYLTRYDHKDGIRDLKKAIQFCEMAIDFKIGKDVEIDVSDKRYISTCVNRLTDQFCNRGTVRHKAISSCVLFDFKECKRLIYVTLSRGVGGDFYNSKMIKDIAKAYLTKCQYSNDQLQYNRNQITTVLCFCLHKYDMTSEDIAEVLNMSEKSVEKQIEKGYTKDIESFGAYSDHLFEFFDNSIKYLKNE